MPFAPTRKELKLRIINLSDSFPVGDLKHLTKNASFSYSLKVGINVKNIFFSFNRVLILATHHPRLAENIKSRVNYEPQG